MCVTERAKLCRRLYRWGGLILLAVAASLACGTGVPTPVPSYDPITRRLIRLDADLNGDGAVDQRTYLDGNRPIRSESDRDGDGRVDRWEYFDERAELRMVGTSRANDGIEDMWTWAVDADGVRRVDYSRRRDHHIDRREFYAGERLMRAEEDTNGDGITDKWEVLEGGSLRQVALDTRLSAGKPDRRLLYDEQGHFSGIEADSDGDGRFEPLPGAATPAGSRRP